ncbi:MAG: triose-phosphate isomerase [Acidobacteriota bacterium]|nr:MAG: triose-phosphate isomerase [Acidobacteriota bacterium]
MARIPVIAGNWKMYKTRPEVKSTLEALRKLVDGVEGVEVVICPTATSLATAAEVLEGSTIRFGAQNVHWAAEGAFTGELSCAMLLDVGCQYVIIGHSERRQYFGETDETVSKRLTQALGTDLTPILCIGETLEEREADRVSDVVLGQLKRALAGLTEDQISRIIIAYEPVWAIGTGRTATPEIAQEVHSMIRTCLEQEYSSELAEGLRILYGGSVKPSNVAELMAQADIDGALVGGASLDAESFAQLVKY